MTIALYMDVHVHRAITTGLRLRDVDVLTAQEDGYRTANDDRLLDRPLRYSAFCSHRMMIYWLKLTDVKRPASLLPALFMLINCELRSVVVFKAWN